MFRLILRQALDSQKTICICLFAWGDGIFPEKILRKIKLHNVFFAIRPGPVSWFSIYQGQQANSSLHEEVNYVDPFWDFAQTQQL